jgi:hypothetical protein
MDPRAVLDAVVKRKIPSPCRESNPRTPIVQPVAQLIKIINTCIRDVTTCTSVKMSVLKYLFTSLRLENFRVLHTELPPLWFLFTDRSALRTDFKGDENSDVITWFFGAVPK